MMTRHGGLALLFVAATMLNVAGCNRAAEEEKTDTTTATQAPAQSGPVEITLKTEPDPVKMGDNTFDVMVMQGRKPIDDATVSVEFYMPAMPEMKMAEMRTKTDLKPAGNGMYRGSGQVMMAGNWDVTVVAMRGGQAIGTKKLTVNAK
jgi:nitrogen fixation protein FixH